MTTATVTIVGTVTAYRNRSGDSIDSNTITADGDKYRHEVGGIGYRSNYRNRYGGEYRSRDGDRHGGMC